MSKRRLEAELLTLHDRFCAGFARRDVDAVLATVADTSDLVVVTSEQPLLRGPGDLRAFLERYVGGPTTYSWTWDRRDACISGGCAWLLAVGTETTSGDLGKQATPYRMTLVARRVGDRWLFVQVHGSSPHHV